MDTAATCRARLPTSWLTPSCCSPGQAGLKKHLGEVIKSSLALWKSFGCSKQNPFKLTYTKEERLLQGYRGISWNSRAGCGNWPPKGLSQGSENPQQPRQSVLVSLCLSVCLSMLCVVWYLHFSQDLLHSFSLYRLTPSFIYIAENGHSISIPVLLVQESAKASRYFQLLFLNIWDTEALYWVE